MLFYDYFYLDKNKTTYFIVSDKAQIYYSDFMYLAHYIGEKIIENILGPLALYLETFIILVIY